MYVTVVAIGNGDSEPELYVFENEELGAQFADIRGGCEYMECLETIPETDARRLIDAEAKERREEERVDEWLESH